MPITKERPDFGPTQIRASKEVKLGDMVIPVHFRDIESPPVQIIGYFIKDLYGDGKRMSKGFIIKNSIGRLEHMYYADSGLLPYSNGWNENNWLKKAI